MIQPCKISDFNIVLILNPIRSLFAKLCKDTKIFVRLANFFAFTKNFGFTLEEIGLTQCTTIRPALSPLYVSPINYLANPAITCYAIEYENRDVNFLNDARARGSSVDILL